MKKGEVYRGFLVTKVTNVEEIHVKVYELIHEKSGAEVIYVAADDDENLFALTFRTYPKDSSGVAHILEHTTLCGSKNYPIHDPFFRMLKRSSNTFMNAFTSKLWTCYPASSKIEKDFYNLLEVYLDACFFPLLKKTSFQQEGHRFAFETPDDPTSPLQIQGIVYNEMKGVLSNPSTFLWRKLMAGLCKDHIYGFDSGGDPEEIPRLTHEMLLDFHKEFYAPSRCNFFFYGNIPIEQHLDFIGEKILDHAEKKKKIPPIHSQKRFTAPRKELSTYPVSDADLSKKTMISFSWLTMDIKDQDDLIAFSLIDSILMDTDASLLRQKLISSGLCIQASSSLDPDARDIPYAITCRGTEVENADPLEKLLFESLSEIASKKIPHDLIESAMHQLEFSRSEISSESQPYALELWGRMVLPHLQGGPLIDGLKIHSLFERLSKLVSDPAYLPSLIRKYLIENPHMYRLTMAPDPQLSEKNHQKELSELEKIRKNLTQDQIKNILKETKQLDRYQKSKNEENVDCLPILAIDDIPKEISYYPLQKHTSDGLVIYHRPVFTNQIIYADLVFDLPQIASGDLLYLRLLGSFLTEFGAGGRNYIDNLNHIQGNVGAIWTSLALNVQRENTQACYPTFSLSCKGLKRKSKELFHLMKDFILTADFHDKERLKELIRQTHSYLQQSINKNAIGYALKESAASFSPWNHLSNIWYGLPYFQFIDSLAQNIEKMLPRVIEKFQTLYNTIFHLNNPHLLLACDEETFTELAQKKFYDFSTLAKASTPFSPWVELASSKETEHKAKLIASPIAHNAESIATITMLSPASAPLKLACYLFDNTEIHQKIREEGGAYSCGSKYNVLTGSFQFYSSRDPNIFTSYEAFIHAVKHVASGKFSEQDLHEAKLSYIQEVDDPVPPGLQASITYFQHKVGLTPHIRQAFRDLILSATKKDVIQAVQEYLLPKMPSSIRITYASQDLLAKNAPLFEKGKFPPLTTSPI